MEVIVNNKKFLVNLFNIGAVDIPHEFGKIYHFDLKNENEITGEMDFYFECYEFTAKLKKFKAKDNDSAKALFMALRYFCFNNRSLMVESQDLNETTGKREFENFIDKFDDDNLNVDKSSKIGYTIYLFDEDDSFNNIEASIIEKEYKQNDLEFNIKEFN